MMMMTRSIVSVENGPSIVEQGLLAIEVGDLASYEQRYRHQPPTCASKYVSQIAGMECNADAKFMIKEILMIIQLFFLSPFRSQ